MKPFDLEAALKGAPVVTRDGRKIVEIHYFEKAKEEMQAVAIDEVGGMWKYYRNGRYYNDRDNNNDLFISEHIVERWVNVYCNGEDLWTNSMHRTEVDAKEKATKENYIKTIRITSEKE